MALEGEHICDKLLGTITSIRKSVIDYCSSPKSNYLSYNDQGSNTEVHNHPTYKVCL